MQDKSNRLLRYASTSCAVSLLLVTLVACSKSKSGSNENKTGSNGTPTEQKTKLSLTAKVIAQRKAERLCSKITLAELKRITGRDFKFAVPISSLHDVPNCHCHYRIGKGAGSEAEEWQYQIVTAISPTLGSQAVEQTKRRTIHEMISGVGDEAVWVPATGYFGVRKGKAYVRVSVIKSMGDAATRLRIAKEIAKLLLQRM